MKKASHILIVEDEASIRDMLHLALAGAGFKISEAQNVKEANQHITTFIPDLILLDWMLPDVSGITFAKQLKENKATKNIRIIMLTARAEEENKIKGLDVGADDYITKPFSPRELIARIKTILRRGIVTMPNDVIELGLLHLDLNTHTLSIQHEKIPLSTIEYKLLHFFMSHPNAIYNREQLLQSVWQDKEDTNDRTVDVLIQRLRKRLESYGCDHYIKTIRGFGYQFSEDNP